MQDLKLTLIQSSLHWESIQANLSMFEEKIWSINESTDLILLPEMFTTGFSMNALSLAEPMNFHTFKWMKQMASQTGAVIAGSIIIKENNHFYNRLIWMQPDGNYFTYDKRHLFRMADEHLVYSSGNKKIIPTVKGWRVLPLICYDLRFPVWSRNKENEYDLAIYLANWPAARRNAWRTLLRARSIENISYTVGINRVGEDGKNLNYAGDSAVIDFKGDDLVDLKNSESILTTTLSYSALQKFRDKFPAFRDADSFSIE